MPMAEGRGSTRAPAAGRPLMTLAHFLTVRGPGGGAARLAAWFRDGPAAGLAALDCVDHLDLYTASPAGPTDPYFDDRDGPLAMVQTGHADVAAVREMLASAAFAAASDLDGAGVPGLRPSHDVMAQEFFAVAGEDAPRPLSAPLSLVVRYHGPCRDPRRFTEHYREGHAPAAGAPAGDPQRARLRAHGLGRPDGHRACRLPPRQRGRLRFDRRAQRGAAGAAAPRAARPHQDLPGLVRLQHALRDGPRPARRRAGMRAPPPHRRPARQRPPSASSSKGSSRPGTLPEGAVPVRVAPIRR